MSVPAFIDITEVDQVSELRQYFENQALKVADVEDPDLFEEVKAIIQATPEIWKENDVKDIEGIVNSILSLMFVIPISKGKELVVLLCENLKLGLEHGKSLVSLKSLHNLFHGYHPKTSFLFDVYCTWIEVGGKCRNVHLIPTDLKQVEKWLEWWEVDEEGKRKLLRLMYEAFVNCNKLDAAFAVMIRLLESYGEDNAAQAREDAIKCIIRAVADPNVYLFDQLLTLKPVQFLEGEPIYDLLNIFVNGNIKDYQEFYEQNAEYINSINLSHASSLHKMKLLTLVDAVNKSHEISFDDIIERLGITEDDVEEFIIDAIQRKLIRGRIDQINRKVIVSQACLRTFGKSQWHQLASKLQHWRNNLKKVNERLQTVQPQA